MLKYLYQKCKFLKLTTESVIKIKNGFKLFNSHFPLFRKQTFILTRTKETGSGTG